MKKLIKGLLFGALTLGLWSCTGSNSLSNKPLNILFIFTDDHAVQAIGAYGSKINKTPHLDRLASEGVLFQNSFCCNSICGPSRAAILTGKHSHLNGFLRNGNKFNGEQVTFPKLLQKAGYQTALIGKWHLVTNPTGFNHWEILPGQGHYYNPDFYKAPGRKIADGQSNIKKYIGYCTDIVTKLSLNWLDQRDKSKPFLLMCQHKAPHRNWSPAPKYLTKYDDVDIPEPETLFDDYENRNGTLKEQEMQISLHMYPDHDMRFKSMVKELLHKNKRSQWGDGDYRRMTPEQREQWDAAYQPKNQAFLKNIPKGKDLVRWKYQRYIKNYLRCIDSVDDNVGRMLDYLDKHNLRKNTVVIYSSDQGFYLGEHGWYDKRWMFEESLKMPLIVSWPGVTGKGIINKQLVQNIDYAPTFLDIAGVKVPEEMQGKSYRAAIENPNKEFRDSIYYHYYEGPPSVHKVTKHEGVRNSRYKLIHFYANSHNTKNVGYNLFDLKEDPNEMKSVHDDPKYKQIFDDMKKDLAAKRQKYKLPALPKAK